LLFDEAAVVEEAAAMSLSSVEDGGGCSNEGAIYAFEFAPWVTDVVAAAAQLTFLDRIFATKKCLPSAK